MPALSRFVGCLLLLGSAGAVRAESPPVNLSENATSFTLANGILTATIEKRTATLRSLRYRDIELVAEKRGYWSFVGSHSTPPPFHASSIRQDPASNGGTIAEVSSRFPYQARGSHLPVNLDLRYALERGSASLAVYAVWDHPPTHPRFSIGEARYALKLNPEVFDTLAVAPNRQRLMPTGEDWDRGTQLEMKEVRRLNTGRHAGHAEHKYDYSVVLADSPAYGWASSARKIGLWVVNPSIEYLAGGPTKVELTGHLDVNRGGLPVLLNMWHGSHYGGSSLVVREGEEWRKCIGPFLLHCNTGETPEAMWREANAIANQARKAWPFAWVKDAAYPPADQRATARGVIRLDDPHIPSPQRLRVGLVAPAYEVAGRRRTDRVDWQRDSKHYQFWTEAGPDGSFSIPHVRAGRYELRAFAENVLGEFIQADVEVSAGGSIDLGTLTWRPVRHGRTLWEIGVPDRTAAEFRHGEHYWQWGLFQKYPKEFPRGVDFQIGKSDSRRDWNYVQPGTVGADGKVRDTTWRVRFPMASAPVGKATLRLGIAGSRTERGVEIRINGKPAGATGPLPDTGVMHRDGIRGYWVERSITFDAALLREGENILELHLPARSWVHSVLYDYLRLELEESPSPR